MKRTLFLFTLVSCFSQVLIAQTQRPPIIDIHVHTMKVNPNWASPMCPWFLSDMPGADPTQQPPGFMNLECLDPLQPAKSDEEMQAEVIKRINDWNMTIVAYGDDEVLRNWHEAAPPGRVIPAIGIDTTQSVQDFREALESGFYKVVAEFAPQYQGMSPSDPVYAPYLAVAEELNIPVGIHMGTGGNGMANITQPKYRASLGNPFLLEDLLARHSKLKIWVMHAGYPMLDEMIALMGANAYVYVDIAGMIWSYPKAEIHHYVQRLVQAGFGKRIIYGTDFMMWPRLFETSMGLIENAQYLSEEQKRDIMFNNAARFFRMEKSDFDWPEEVSSMD
ncbi:amidohydrolase family protein [Rhodohalobacter sp. 614A]|uniref:amidohydrolase family protein n=1 Tax=Rhodohalobacter sp. 614A TaxID=2908649 RepID=UPI001F1EF8BF|nr:amidohydrolase family protein [Rhodohalobacter sp. 614A]